MARSSGGGIYVLGWCWWWWFVCCVVDEQEEGGGLGGEGAKLFTLPRNGGPKVNVEGYIALR